MPWPGALKLDDLIAVVIDVSAVNAKEQNILNMRDTHNAMMDLFNTGTIKTRLDVGSVKLLIY